MMKKALTTLSIALALTVLAAGAAYSQGYYGMGPGMMGGWHGGYGPGWGYGMGPGMMGGGMGPGMMGGWGWVNIPPKLPAPKNAEWVKRLREILVKERQSLAQYIADQERFNVHMPYWMVIPQEENHIQWIGLLFAAYGLPADGQVPAVIRSATLTDAYRLCVKLEADLLPRYEWLVRNAGDPDTARTLNTILLQSRMHMVMFEHALRMGGGGPGMMGGYGMGPGMMGGYGYGYGPGYGGYGPRGQSEACRKFLDDTKDLRKQLDVKRYDYFEAMRNAKVNPEDVAKDEKDVRDLQEKIRVKDPGGCWW